MLLQGFSYLIILHYTSPLSYLFQAGLHSAESGCFCHCFKILPDPEFGRSRIRVVFRSGSGFFRRSDPVFSKLKSGSGRGPPRSATLLSYAPPCCSVLIINSCLFFPANQREFYLTILMNSAAIT